MTCKDCKYCRNTYGYDQCYAQKGAPKITWDNPCDDFVKRETEKMDNQKAIKELVDMLLGYPMANPRYDALYLAIKALEDLPKNDDWIPIKTRKPTEEEKEKYPDSDFMYDCQLPDDGEEVLITTSCGDVVEDTFCRDGDYGCYFENYCDEGDVVAWRSKPEPYKEGDKE